MTGAYLLVLIFVLICLAAIDYHHKLVFFYDWRRALKVSSVVIIFFALWDILGILAGIFFIGENPYLTGINFGPNFPLEELFFLMVLVYNPLLIYRFLQERSK